MVQAPLRQFENAAKGTWDNKNQEKEWNAFEGNFRKQLFDELEPTIEDLINAGLSSQEARVAALKAEGMSHAATAVALEIDESTVGEYVRRVRSKRQEAEELLGALRSYGIDL